VKIKLTKAQTGWVLLAIVAVLLLPMLLKDPDWAVELDRRGMLTVYFARHAGRRGRLCRTNLILNTVCASIWLGAVALALARKHRSDD